MRVKAQLVTDFWCALTTMSTYFVSLGGDTERLDRAIVAANEVVERSDAVVAGGEWSGEVGADRTNTKLRWVGT